MGIDGDDDTAAAVAAATVAALTRSAAASGAVGAGAAALARAAATAAGSDAAATRYYAGGAGGAYVMPVVTDAPSASTRISDGSSSSGADGGGAATFAHQQSLDGNGAEEDEEERAVTDQELGLVRVGSVLGSLASAMCAFLLAGPRQRRPGQHPAPPDLNPPYPPAARLHRSPQLSPEQVLAALEAVAGHPATASDELFARLEHAMKRKEGLAARRARQAVSRVGGGGRLHGSRVAAVAGGSGGRAVAVLVISWASRGLRKGASGRGMAVRARLHEGYARPA